MNMKFGTWNVRSPYRADSLKTTASELAKHNLDLVAMKEVTWDEGGIEPAHNYTFRMEIGMLTADRNQANTVKRRGHGQSKTSKRMKRRQKIRQTAGEEVEKKAKRKKRRNRKLKLRGFTNMAG
jgi:hypothetical protein